MSGKSACGRGGGESGIGKLEQKFGRVESRRWVVVRGMCEC